MRTDCCVLIWQPWTRTEPRFAFDDSFLEQLERAADGADGSRRRFRRRRRRRRLGQRRRRRFQRRRGAPSAAPPPPPPPPPAGQTDAAETSGTLISLHFIFLTEFFSKSPANPVFHEFFHRVLRPGPIRLLGLI